MRLVLISYQKVCSKTCSISCQVYYIRSLQEVEADIRKCFQNRTTKKLKLINVFPLGGPHLRRIETENIIAEFSTPTYKLATAGMFLLHFGNHFKKLLKLSRRDTNKRK